MGKPSSQLWCFTNYDLSFNYETYYDNIGIQYIIYGLETCPKTKRLHHQGFVYFEGNRCSTKNVAKELGKCHVKMCDGNIDQNCDYCSKDDNVVEWGERPNRQGNRVDLNAVKQWIVNREMSVDEIALLKPMIYHQYGRTLHKIEDIVLRGLFRTEMTKGIWYWGKTGIGKSHRAFDGFTPSSHYVYPNDNGWWDGYVGQETVIINEFRGAITYSLLLDLCDKWAVSVKRRGREPVPFISKTIIITSSMPPEEVYCNLAIADGLEQLHRRFKVIELEAEQTENKIIRSPKATESAWG